MIPDADGMRRDPIGALLDFEGDSAEIVTDDVNGYDRVIPDPKLLEEMAALYAKAIEDTDKDYESIWAKLVENQKAYECESDQNETITIPVVKRIVNQQIAWQGTQILNKNPIISVKPIDGGSYQIPAQLLTPPSTAQQPGAQYQTQTLTAEDAANLYESFLQFKFTEKIDFEQLVEDTVAAIHIGEAPTWWKVYYDPQTTAKKRRKFAPVEGQDDTIQFMGLEDTSVLDGEAVKISHLSNQMVTMPVDEQDEQQASWLAERGNWTNSKIWEGFKTKRFDFCLPEGEKVDIEEVKKLLGMATDGRENSLEQQIAQLDMRVAQTPGERHDVRMVWFFYPIKRTVKIPHADAPSNPDGSRPQVEQETIEIRSLCGYLHLKARKWLNLYCNPNWSGKRPYIPFFMRKRPHRFSGTTSAGDIAPIQRLISNIFHLEIQNGVQQNVKVFLIRNNSATWNFFKKQDNALKPGLKIPYDDKDDVSPVQLGSPVQSMAPEISFLNSQAESLAVERDYTDIPNRTAAATVAQVESLAKMQPQTILRGTRRAISKAVAMYLQTVSQYHIFETIPFLDEEQNKMTQMLISFPQDAIENHFSFHVTATGDEDSDQGQIEKTTILLKEFDQRNEALLKLTDIAMDPRMPRPHREVALELAIGRELVFGQLLQPQRQDFKRILISEKKFRALMAEVDDLFQKAQQAEANKPPPVPEPPKISVSLKGDLTPPEENALAAKAIGGPIGQNVPPPGPGGSIPNVPTGQPGPPGIPGQPDGQGSPQPLPQGDLQAGAAPVGPVQ